MKKLGFNLGVLILVLLTFSSCKKEVKSNGRFIDSSDSSSEIHGKWNLIRLYGGIMGVNETHASGEIEWTFNPLDSTLTINNTVGSSSYYFLPSGIYGYHQLSDSLQQNYLIIDGTELGQFVISDGQMFIDDNKKSTGEGACGFYLILERD